MGLDNPSNFASDFFKRGSSLNCPYSALEEWKMLYKPNVSSTCHLTCYAFVDQCSNISMHDMYISIFSV